MNASSFVTPSSSYFPSSVSDGLFNHQSFDITPYRPTLNCDKKGDVKESFAQRVNRFGYFPVTGQVVAVGRAVYGSLTFAISVIMAVGNYLVTGETNGWKDRAVVGLKHLFRSLIEVIPVVGGASIYVIDRIIQNADDLEESDTFAQRVNRFGYFPIAGQVIAVARVAYGVLKFTISSAMLIGSYLATGKTNGWKENAFIGLDHIARAAIEMIPIVGGYTMYRLDSLEEELDMEDNKHDIFQAIENMAKAMSVVKEMQVVMKEGSKEFIADLKKVIDWQEKIMKNQDELANKTGKEIKELKEILEQCWNMFDKFVRHTKTFVDHTNQIFVEFQKKKSNNLNSNGVIKQH